MKSLCYRASVAALPLLLALPCIGQAQPVQAPTQAEAQAALNQAPPPFTPAQLDQLLAPIALYPDQLLTQVLMAATFPDQLVAAENWLQDSNNAALKGDDLANALQPLPWDPSIKSLVAFPQIIAMMTNHLDWTQALGTAFANQEVETMARVQFLRERAMRAGQLKSTNQIAVSQQDSDIVIEPADPNMIYVPVYNPAVVYGDWPDNDAPPVYIPPPPNFYSGEIGAGIGFSIGFGIVAPLWGWGHPDWRHHRFDIDPSRYEHITNQTYITQNHISIEGGAWHRTGPIAQVPEAQRPHPPEERGPQPPGTIRPSAIVRPLGAEHGAPTGPAHPAEEVHPGAPPGPQHPAEEAHPGVPPGPPHPAEEVHPGAPAGPAHPAEEARPGVPPGPPHPAEEAHPGAPPAPHPAGEAHPGQPAGPPHPVEEAHPTEEHAAPPHPAEAPSPPTIIRGGPAEEPRPPEAPHPAAPPIPLHPAETPHPPGPPAAPHPAPPAPPHPAPPHPAEAPHPAAKPAPKPGEQKPEEQH